MALMLHRNVVIPVWLVAFFAIAFSADPSIASSLIAMLGITAMAFMLPGVVRACWRVSQPQPIPALAHRVPSVIGREQTSWK